MTRVFSYTPERSVGQNTEEKALLAHLCFSCTNCSDCLVDPRRRCQFYKLLHAAFHPLGEELGVSNDKTVANVRRKGD